VRDNLVGDVMTHSTPAGSPEPNDDGAVRALYFAVLDAWNRKNAADFAAAFEDDGCTIGFDGSLLDGRVEIESGLAKIFADHPTGRYVAKVQHIRFATPDVALLRAMTGMVTPGQTGINPAVNAWQTIVAVRDGDGFRIAKLQNTPAAFHGRPELVRQMTDELTTALRESDAR
jgi:uncharacterized protein (TIGR02246 family)